MPFGGYVHQHMFFIAPEFHVMQLSPPPTFPTGLHFTAPARRAHTHFSTLPPHPCLPPCTHIIHISSPITVQPCTTLALHTHPTLHRAAHSRHTPGTPPHPTPAPPLAALAPPPSPCISHTSYHYSTPLSCPHPILEPWHLHTLHPPHRITRFTPPEALSKAPPPPPLPPTLANHAVTSYSCLPSLAHVWECLQPTFPHLSDACGAHSPTVQWGDHKLASIICNATRHT